MQKEHNELIKKITFTPPFWRTFFAVSGVVATIAYRITFLFDPFWAKIIWYVGTIGFVLYFGHRARVEDKRAKLVKDYGLINAIEESDIRGQERVALSYLIKTSLTSKARFNSAFIFYASLAALVASTALGLYHLYIHFLE